MPVLRAAAPPLASVVPEPMDSGVMKFLTKFSRTVSRGVVHHHYLKILKTLLQDALGWLSGESLQRLRVGMTTLTSGTVIVVDSDGVLADSRDDHKMHLAQSRKGRQVRRDDWKMIFLRALASSRASL